MSDSTAPRRTFIARLAAGATALGAAPLLAAIGCAPAAPATPAAPPGDELDTWLGGMKGTYKVIYDAVEPGGGPNGVLFARNFMTLSQEKLGTKDADMNVVVSFRHFATPYAFNDAMWAKYPPFAAMLKVEDATTKKPAVRNVPLHDEVQGFSGASLPALAARGVHFTACGAATTFIAGLLAGKTGDAKAIEAELAANLVPNARMVPAGVVVVQRAQKAGFAYTFAG
jgi:intracellular sulfur oxidation DsrE/DsrF family protein